MTDMTRAEEVLERNDAETKAFRKWLDGVYETLSEKRGIPADKLRYAPTCDTGAVALDLYVAFSWGIKPEVVAEMLAAFMKFKAPYLYGEPRTPYWYQMR
jgi:hypothetical protein